MNKIKILVFALVTFIAASAFAQLSYAPLGELFKDERPLTQRDIDIFVTNARAFAEAGKRGNPEDTMDILGNYGLDPKRSLYTWTKIVINFRLYHAKEYYGQNITAQDITYVQNNLPLSMRVNSAEIELIGKNKAQIKVVFDYLDRELEGY